MSTYDGAYQDRRVNGLMPKWATPCTCDDDKENPWCCHHGKYKDGYKTEEENE